MSLNLSIPDSMQLTPRITVVGVGGAGGNAVNNMINAQLEGVEFIVCNTDAQALNQSQAERRIQLGQMITHGLGAGARPEVGRAAAQETMEEISEYLDGSHMVFVTAGMGGGTGTGAAPVIAQIAREKGILTVGVVTKPFHFEGTRRMRLADSGIDELQKYVDTLIVIPNQNLFRVANERTTFADAFKMADDVLYAGVRGVTDLMVMPGLINLDFADIRTVMSEMGKAMMGTGEAGGDNRAIEAAEAAISNPLLDDVSMKGARGVLINITGGGDMTLYEVDEAANRIREEVDPEAHIIFGSTFDPSLEGTVRVSVVATGIDAEEVARQRARREQEAEAAARGQSQARNESQQAAAMQQAPQMAAAGGARRTVVENPAPVVTTARSEGGRSAQPQMPRGEVEDGSFIAPEPVRAPERQPTRIEAAEEPLALEPAPRAVEQQPARAVVDDRPATEAAPRKFSFLQRMTGAHRRESEATARPAAEEPRRAPRLDHVDGGATARQQPADEENDLLEIPAFLRRQAN
ncbi:cell division protein FtsZ [uncultured Tistrella sp.]|uniref:cell division protein FtsZ n=1 Tax=Tistrella mobilis TaxID=171437 RepID=UPI00260B3815|nr:cell division protein FtsZ [uncultured Tistrella sp.]